VAEGAPGPAPVPSAADPTGILALLRDLGRALPAGEGAPGGGSSLAQAVRDIVWAPLLHVVLQGIPLLGELPPAELEALAGRLHLLDFPAGTVIRRQGEHDPHLYAVVLGRVDVTAGTETRPHVRLAEYGPGTLFGRTPRQSDAPNFHTTAALERTLALALDIDDLVALTERFPGLAAALDRMYQGRAVRYGLRLVPFFAELDESSLDEIAGHASLRRYERDEVVLRQGEPATAMHVVVRGTVKVAESDEQGERVLAYLKRGAHFGEIGLLRRRPHGASVRAVTTVETLQLEPYTFDFIRLAFPAVGEAIADIVRKREEENDRRANDRSVQTAMQLMEGLVDSTDALVIDLRRCVRCDTCERTCLGVTGHRRLRRTGERLGSWVFATACRHCRDPACMECPRSAIVRDRSGEIHFGDECIGCGACARACPYGSISIVETPGAGPGGDPPVDAAQGTARGRGTERNRRRAVKCDLCADRACMACVYNCPTGALRRVSPEAFLRWAGGGS